jgi:hypothetical protein
VTPAPPITPVPGQLFLTIGEPADQSIVRTSPVTIRGQTLPDAVVSINGELVEADANGNFSQGVALDEGTNVFDIIATDEGGNEATLEFIVFFLRGG